MRDLTYRYGAGFTFQWHLTVDCGAACAHCYCKDPETFRYESDGIDGKKALEILDALDRFYARFERRFKKKIRRGLVLTGGDPLLAPFFDDILQAAHARGYRIGVLGCPETVTDERARFLAQNGVRAVQFSIDGLEEEHDALRGLPGSFERTLARAAALQRRFNVNLMATVHPGNADQVVPLLERLHKAGIRAFDFARVSFLGGGGDFEAMSPQAYKDFLEGVWQKEKELAARGSELMVGKKDPLWRLFLFEKGLYSPPPERKLISGCPCGVTSLAILADGTVMMCRRFLSPLGKLPGDDLAAIYAEHPLLEKLRDPKNLEGCSACLLRNVCRGCAAVGASYHGRPGRRDPQCWRIVLR